MKKLLNTSLLLFVFFISIASYACDGRTIQVKGPSGEIYSIAQTLDDKGVITVTASCKDEIIYSATHEYALSQVINLCASAGTYRPWCPPNCVYELSMEITLDNQTKVQKTGQIYEAISGYPNYVLIVVNSLRQTSGN